MEQKLASMSPFSRYASHIGTNAGDTSVSHSLAPRSHMADACVSTLTLPRNTLSGPWEVWYHSGVVFVEMQVTAMHDRQR